MTYITQTARDEIDGGRPPSTPGELNYAITKLLKGYIDFYGLRYDVIADVLSACEGAKLEFYRRVAEPYEDEKLATNGDIYK